MDVHTSYGEALPEGPEGAALDARFGFRRGSSILPKRSCQWCAPLAGPRVFHRACGLHQLSEQEAEVYGRMARVSIDTLAAACYPGAREDDWRPMLAASAAVYARNAASAALRLIGREEAAS